MTYYFAYGSCVNETDLHRTTPSARNPRFFVAEGYKGVFDVWAERRQCGAANLRPSPEDSVGGILWEVDELATLDEREGHPHVYRRTTIRVVKPATGETVDAVTYIAPEGPDYAPSDEYLALRTDSIELWPEWKAWLEEQGTEKS